MENKKITLEHLIKNAEKGMRKKETQALYVKSLEGSITIEEPDKSLCIEANAMSDDESDDWMVYNIVIEPNLKNPELHKAYGVVRPIEIVQKIFKGGESSLIAQAGLKLAGYVNGVEEIKN